MVHRLAEKQALSLSEAENLFADTKRFLFLCSIGFQGPMVPPEAIDEGWHNFILFTADYLDFCKKHFGRFVHHRPRRPEDPPGDGSGIRRTLELAHVVFGELSSNWHVPQPKVDENCTPSTACQDAPPEDCATNQ